jgi:hypothetical protein
MERVSGDDRASAGEALVVVAWDPVPLRRKS